MARKICLSAMLLGLLCASVSHAETPAGEHSGHEPRSPKQPVHPRTLPDAHPNQTATPWSKEEVDTARAHCNAVLARLKVVASPVDPIRDGECGSPAPVEVVSIGSNPEVTLSTPVVMSCDLVAGLYNWLRLDVQPAAREILGSPVVRLDIMSGYSCRNAYGRKKTRLSEHGRVNAIDVGAFLTRSGESVDVLHFWGQTERDIRAQIAASAAASKQQAAKTEAIKREAERVQAAVDAQRSNETVEYRRDMAAPGLRGSIIGDQAPAGGSSSPPAAALGLQPSRLGGPKQQTSAAVVHGTVPSSKKQSFLRRVHAAACKVFGTTLGPEANDAHRNHFHLDMAERHSGNYCE